MNVLDLFAGPGGWDVGARSLGLDPLGVEWDGSACDTRRAAGLRTLQADVSTLDPDEFAPVDLLIASPPCQAWSLAGKGGGRRDQELVGRTIAELSVGIDRRAELREHCADPRSLLVVEPYRFARALRPRWIAMEETPTVLPFWKLTGEYLRDLGYAVWSGVLSAEQYGVPQTRKRAILMATRGRTVAPPEPTHQRYVPGEPAAAEVGLFGEVKPWVSMADALGWGMTERPAPTLIAGSNRTGGIDPLDGGSGARQMMRDAKERGAWRYYRSGSLANQAVRSLDEPAPTIHFGNDAAAAGWVADADGQVKDGGARLSPSEGGVLQTFPVDHPWHGSKRDVFRQIGDAVPPLLARAVLAALVPEEAR